MWRGIHVHNKDVCWNLTYHSYTDILEYMTKNQNVLDLAHSDSHIHTSKSNTFNELWIPKPNPENVTRAEAYNNVSPHDTTAYF